MMSFKLVEDLSLNFQYSHQMKIERSACIRNRKMFNFSGNIQDLDLKVLIESCLFA